MSKRVFFLITVLVTSGFCFAADEPSEKITNTVITAEQRKRVHEADEKRMQKIKHEDAALRQWFDDLKPFNVYGMVADNAGNLIEGAKIKIQWEHAEYNTLGQIVTKWIDADKEGRFVVELGNGDIEPHIYEVQREGYEFKRVYSSYFAKDKTGQNNPLLSTSKEHPVVLTLRKKGKTTLLVEDKDVIFTFPVEESGKTRARDFIQQHRIKNLEKPVLNGETLVCDLQVTATLATNSTWTIVMKPGNPSGGIMVSEKMLYEAPQEGFQPEFVFVAQGRKEPKDMHIYLKSRDPEIYTRLDIESVIVAEKFVRIDMRSITNPYGDRNLEGEPDMPFEVKKKLTDEAKAAHRHGKHPEKPDLPKLIKDAKEKGDKGKDKQDNSP